MGTYYNFRLACAYVDDGEIDCGSICQSDEEYRNIQKALGLFNFVEERKWWNCEENIRDVSKQFPDILIVVSKTPAEGYEHEFGGTYVMLNGEHYEVEYEEFDRCFGYLDDYCDYDD